MNREHIYVPKDERTRLVEVLTETFSHRLSCNQMPLFCSIEMSDTLFGKK